VDAYCVDKGSVALNGVSLTLNSVIDDAVSVMLIPHTLSVTSLGKLAVGDKVNVEYDPMAKLIAKHMARYHKKMTVRHAVGEEQP
jgi:Riboflavin synthase alpha chain